MPVSLRSHLHFRRGIAVTVRLLPAVAVLLPGIIPPASASPQNSPGEAASTPAFSRDVAPILYKNCVECHRAQGSAPFSLVSYEDVRRRARQIAEVTSSRFMPPWKAEHGYGSFMGERRLTDREIATLKRWADTGMRKGGMPGPLPKFTGGWKFGTPDVVVMAPAPFRVGAEGVDTTLSFVVPIPVKSDIWLKAAEFRPSNPRIVRHVSMYLDRSQMARKIASQFPTTGVASMGGPGMSPAYPNEEMMPGWLPLAPVPDAAIPLHPGTDLVVVVQCHPDGKPEQERPSVGLYLSKVAPPKYIGVVPVTTNQIFIKPGEKDVQVRAEFRLPVSVSAVGIVPHAHYLCTHIESYAVMPDGTHTPLLRISDWDYDRRDVYRYRSPIPLPAGSMVVAEFTYDNSAENPRNPRNPPRFVMWGAQTMDEMASLWLQVTVNSEADAARLAVAVRQAARAQADLHDDPHRKTTRSRFRAWQLQRDRKDAPR